jgi:hypothetical protein
VPQIEIDFDVFKGLTNLRSTEEVTYNDVLRELLNLPAAAKVSKPKVGDAKPWIVSNTSFPTGSEFIADYKGKAYTGAVIDGRLQLSDGRVFTTPSAAAVHITGNNVNGWRFWKCRLPNTSRFVLIERLRGKTY